jgi:hypothetical protein
MAAFVLEEIAASEVGVLLKSEGEEEDDDEEFMHD